MTTPTSSATANSAALSRLSMDERNVLASVDASLQEQNVYEERVIREATHQLAPALNPLEGPPGFPPLDALSAHQGGAKVADDRGKHGQRARKRRAASDVPHVHNLLNRIRQRQQKLQGAPRPQTESSEEEANMLHLKEQMLLSFLSSVAHLPAEDMPIRLDQERASEQRRSMQIVRQRQKEMKEKAVEGSKTRGLKDQQQRRPTVRDAQGGAKSVARRQRIPMMKRKRDQQQQGSKRDEEEEEEIAQRKERLKKLREQRKQRKEERRRLFKEGGDSDSENERLNEDSEEEFHDTVDGTELKQGDDENPASDKNGEISKVAASASEPASNTVEQEPGFSSTLTTRSASVVCPICQETILTPVIGEADSVLALHMSQCQQVRRSRRSNRSGGHDVSMGSLDGSSTSGQPVKHASTKTPATKKKNKRKSGPSSLRCSRAPSLDDIEESDYDDRVDDWIDNGLSRMKEMKERDDEDALPGGEQYPGGLWIPAWVNDRLFQYQRAGIRWMWDLHVQDAGGIVGDEMGLGKTVQVSSFLGAMAGSRKLKSVLVVSPATMLQHWLNELARWAPGLRRVLIHPSGEGDGRSRAVSTELLQSLKDWLRSSRADRLYEPIDVDDLENMEPHSFCGTGYVIVTTYANLRRNNDIYSAFPWSYLVLDEAQQIRNPDAEITLACKRIRTPHRLALSGTPIQNDLKELWSLFDFAFPGRLGTLPAFEQEFADPIRRGGYSNASPVQVQLAYRCALVLKDLIDPYLLRRQKKEVKEVNRMPGKTEHVLFCRLSERQRAMYEAYLESDAARNIMRGAGNLLSAVTVMRKICNHPDLVCDPDKASFESFVKNGYVHQGEPLDDEDSFSDPDEEDFADESLMERSGKLEVLSKILPLWHEQGHRVLIFCQWRKMLTIIQGFTSFQGWKFGRLDGNTSVAARQRLVDTFNEDKSYMGLLCTTRTGGVGLNLTGADRIIIYDPDWNPQTDAQARERAWRFGQEREVTIYRLITAGTVEEKIYQRQIFKTALSNKVLQDPRQRRLFSQRDLRDLFTLKSDTGSMRSGGDGVTETGETSGGVGVVAPDEEEPTPETSQDNQETLKKVMNSKGLAGVFDHHFVEQDPSRKTVTVREMEDRAKRIAREAVNALRRSVASNDPFTPTWTGSAETETGRFGSSRDVGTARSFGRLASSAPGGKSSASSGSLLADLRQRNAAVDSGGPPGEESAKYAKLLSRINTFVQRRLPSTDDILREFSELPDCDAVIFRRLLKSVAFMEKGRWYPIEDGSNEAAL